MTSIFTPAERKALKNRLLGNKEDKTGIYHNRVKPKVIELLEVWIPLKRDLKKLVKEKKNRDNIHKIEDCEG